MTDDQQPIDEQQLVDQEEPQNEEERQNEQPQDGRPLVDLVGEETRQDEQARLAKAGINTFVPHSARIWNYWQGGKDNYEADRIAGDQVIKVFPGMESTAASARHYLCRVVRFLAEQGIGQFLDIGTGLPAVDNTHEIVERVNPDAQVVYVDNDPLVLVHARALLTGEEGAVGYVDADLRDPDQLLRRVGRRLDFTEPVALMLMGILGHMGAEHADRQDAYLEARGIVSTLVDALPAGSYLAVYDCTDTDPGIVEAERLYMASGAVPYLLRSPEQIAGFFQGLELVEPGVVTVTHWRPEVASVGGTAPPEVPAYGGVALKSRQAGR